MEISAIGLLTILHLIFILALIGLVLIQDSKGGAMGIFSSGGSGSVFGSSGGADFLVKATRYVAVGFAVTCLSLTYVTSHHKGSVIDKVAAPISTQMETGSTTAKNEATDTPVSTDDKKEAEKETSNEK